MILSSKSDITQDHLKEYLVYDPLSGHLTWRKKLSRKTVVGRRAGTRVKNRDNRIIKVFGHVYMEHRLIWLMYYGYMPKSHEHIDHINHCEHDNSIGNLRMVSQRENNKNNSIRKDNVLRVTGVWINKQNSRKKYMAEIKDGETRYLKSFYSLEAAIQQRKDWEVELGFHENHGTDKIV